MGGGQNQELALGRIEFVTPIKHLSETWSRQVDRDEFKGRVWGLRHKFGSCQCIDRFKDQRPGEII